MLSNHFIQKGRGSMDREVKSEEYVQFLVVTNLQRRAATCTHMLNTIIQRWHFISKIMTKVVLRMWVTVLTVFLVVFEESVSCPVLRVLGPRFSFVCEAEACNLLCHVSLYQWDIPYFSVSILLMFCLISNESSIHYKYIQMYV